MQLLNEIIINRAGQHPALIQLLQGDLSAIPAEHAADILILSAYPGSYIPVPKTLIAALNDKGLSVEEMARHKAIDLRDQLGCWLSAPLTTDQQKAFNFKNILCFEPWHHATNQAAIVGNIFRCINTFAFNENNNVITMPVLASGKQKVPFEKMLPAMLDASIFWMESGLPLNCIKLVVFSEEQAKQALPVFIRAKQQNQIKQSVREGNITGATAIKLLAEKQEQQLPGEGSMHIVASEIKKMAEKEEAPQQINNAPATGINEMTVAVPNPSAFVNLSGTIPDALPPENKNGSPENKSLPPVTAYEYDYFVSYAHTHTAVVDVFVNNLTAAKKLQVFYDKSTIPQGGLWIKQISDALQKSKKVLIFLSPDYSASPVCWDEFQCAKLMEYNRKKQIIQTVYLYNDTAMPPIMGIYSWSDCREGDAGKLEKMAAGLIAAMAAT